jgi:DNA-binding MarR family transcriptional regulator
MNPVQKTSDKIITQWMEITRLLRQQMSGTKKDLKMQMHALMIIKDNDGLTMKEFAEFLHVTSPSATSFVNRLVKMKWIKRSADKTNRKLVRLKLTTEGFTMIATKMKEHMRVMRDLFELLNATDQREFARILTTLRTTLATQTKK